MAFCQEPISKSWCISENIHAEKAGHFHYIEKMAEET